MVEKTALAEAEVEYEDYTSDTVWVKFPVSAPVGGGSTSSSQADRGRLLLERRIGGYLDDHAVDDAGQSRDQLFTEDRVMAFIEVTQTRPKAIGSKRRSVCLGR